MSGTTPFLPALVVVFLFLLPQTGFCERRESGGEISFVTYNVRNFFNARTAERNDQAGEKPAVEVERMLEILEELAPQILGILEIGNSGELDFLQEALAERGVVLPHGIVSGGDDRLRHLALLSAYPIKADHSQADVIFELEGKFHRMRRGILEVEIEVPGLGLLHVVGVHLKSKREVPFFNQAAFRAREARELRGRLDAIFEENPEALVLLWGDFNATKNEPEIRRIAGRRHAWDGMMAADLADSTGARWTHYWAEADLYSRIDYVFLSKMLHPRFCSKHSFVGDPEGWNLVSDHRPLKVHLQW